MEDRKQRSVLQWLLASVLLAILIVTAISSFRRADRREKELLPDPVTVEEAVNAMAYLSTALSDDFMRTMKSERGVLTVGESRMLLEEALGSCPALPSSQLAMSGVPVSEKGFWQLFLQLAAQQTQEDIWTESVEIYGTAESAPELSGRELCTSRGRLYDRKDASLRKETDHTLLVTGAGSQILYCWKRLASRQTYPNVLITQAGEGHVQIFVNGVTRNFVWAQAEDREREMCADVTVQDGQLVQMTVKEQQIREKVLRVAEDGVELENSGWIPFAKEVRFYKGYGSPEMQTADDVLVGYTFERFFLEEGRICAAVMTQSFHGENIRVLLRTDGFAGLFHQKVTICGEGDYYVFYAGRQEFHPAGETVTFAVGDACFSSGRVIVKPVEADAGLRVDSLEREGGRPRYPGSLELNLQDDGISLVNEVRLEKYLELVVPSEVSAAYSPEALRAQAICARTYGWLQIRQNALRQYGAHVDDSENFQVYNNLPETDKTSAAVQDTYGQVLSYEGKVVPAYYFSTSWGNTTDPSIWGGSADSIAYLRPLQVSAEGFAQETGLTEKKGVADLKEEETFRQALAREEADAFEKNATWFRWTTELTLKELAESIRLALPERIVADEKHIRIQDLDSGEWLSAEELSEVRDLGAIQSMEVLQRVGGGSVQKLKIVGAKRLLIAEGQSNVRRLLGCFDAVYETETGAVQAGRDLLQSSFFWLEEKKKDGILTGYRIHGGGKGHGLGMPQNAMRAMGDAGYTAEEILGFFYPGTELESVY